MDKQSKVMQFSGIGSSPCAILTRRRGSAGGEGLCQHKVFHKTTFPCSVMNTSLPVVQGLRVEAQCDDRTGDRLTVYHGYRDSHNGPAATRVLYTRDTDFHPFQGDSRDAGGLMQVAVGQLRRGCCRQLTASRARHDMLNVEGGDRRYQEERCVAVFTAAPGACNDTFAPLRCIF